MDLPSISGASLPASPSYRTNGALIVVNIEYANRFNGLVDTGLIEYTYRVAHITSAAVTDLKVCCVVFMIVVLRRVAIILLR